VLLINELKAVEVCTSDFCGKKMITLFARLFEYPNRLLLKLQLNLADLIHPEPMSV
jgi:hypothetical protein